MAEDFIQSPPDSPGGKRVHASLYNDGVNDVYTQVTMLADRLNPTDRQAVDNRGAAKIAFNNGEPDFTVFGRTTVTEANLMGVYKFYQKDYVNSFHVHSELGATVGRDATEFGMKLTNPITAGAKSGYYSHRHYQYKPGNSMPLMFTYKASDEDKAGLVRCIGWFGNEGAIRMAFVMKDDGVSIEISDSVLGTSTIVPRAQWSDDRLNGLGGDNNLSGATYNGLKNNIWWIDFQFLSAGAIRFGTWVNGRKVLCHVQGHYNELDRPYLSEARYSFGMEQTNVGTTASTSEMVCFCAVIVNDGYDEFDRTTVSISNDVVLNSTSFVPVLSYRPTQLKDNSSNRDRLVPNMTSLIAEGDVGVELISEVNTVLTDATWTESVDGVEYDIAATAITTRGLRKVGSMIAANRDKDVDLATIFPIQTSGITRHYHPETSDHVTVLAKLRSNTGAQTTSVGVSVVIAQVE